MCCRIEPKKLAHPSGLPSLTNYQVKSYFTAAVQGALRPGVLAVIFSCVAFLLHIRLPVIVPRYNLFRKGV
ncbi:TPA: hypothetical protein ACGH3C_004505 [Salmonella enterica subsp. enterica serovar Javiana]